MRHLSSIEGGNEDDARRAHIAEVVDDHVIPMVDALAVAADHGDIERVRSLIREVEVGLVAIKFLTESHEEQRQVAAEMRQAIRRAVDEDAPVTEA